MPPVSVSYPVVSQHGPSAQEDPFCHKTGPGASKWQAMLTNLWRTISGELQFGAILELHGKYPATVHSPVPGDPS